MISYINIVSWDIVGDAVSWIVDSIAWDIVDVVASFIFLLDFLIIFSQNFKICKLKYNTKTINKKYNIYNNNKINNKTNEMKTNQIK